MTRTGREQITDVAADSWARRPGETKQAHEFFLRYRDLGKRRTLRQLAADTGKSLGTLGRWSVDYEWQARVDQWDAHQDREQAVADLEAIATMRRRHAQIAGLMLAKSYERLASIDPATLSPAEVRQWIAEAMRLERLARGEPGEIRGIVGQTGTSPIRSTVAPVQTDDRFLVDALTGLEEAGRLPEGAAESVLELLGIDMHAVLDEAEASSRDDDGDDDDGWDD